MPQVTGPITTTSLSDIYPTHDALFGLDGLRSVADHAARNAIPNVRSRLGMVVYTQSDGKYWTLTTYPVTGTDADWTRVVADQSDIAGAVQGLVVKALVRLATDGTALPTNTYANGTLGVGATLTATANGALTIDGVAVAASDRVLIKDEATGANDGIYDVTATGDASNPYILTRSVDLDQATEIAGAYTFVSAGTTNAGSGWTVIGGGSYTVGTTAISWTQFSSAGSISAGNGLFKTGSVLSVGAGAGILTGVGLTSVDFTAVQAKNSTLDAVSGLATTGLISRTGSGTAAARTLTAASAKITVTNGDGVAGNPTINLGTVAESDITGLVSDLSAKMNNPMTTLGDLAYGGISGNPVRLVGDTSGALKILTSTGSGGVATAPTWTTPSSSLLSDSANLVTLTGAQTVTGAKTFNAGAFLDKGNQVFDVRAYGAKADFKLFNDGVMTNGSAVLTSASNPFTVGMVGMMCVVKGADPLHNGGYLKTTIASYQSAGQVTLATVAGAAVSGAQFTFATDSYTAFANAVSDAKQVGGTIYVPAGSYGKGTGKILHIDGLPVRFIGDGKGISKIIGFDGSDIIGLGVDQDIASDLTFDARTNHCSSAFTLVANYTTAQNLQVLGSPAAFAMYYEGPAGSSQGAPTYNTHNRVLNVDIEDDIVDDGFSFSFQQNAVIANVNHIGSRLAIFVCQDVDIINYDYTPGVNNTDATNGFYITEPSSRIRFSGFRCHGGDPVISSSPTQTCQDISLSDCYMDGDTALSIRGGDGIYFTNAQFRDNSHIFLGVASGVIATNIHVSSSRIPQVSSISDGTVNHVTLTDCEIPAFTPVGGQSGAFLWNAGGSTNPDIMIEGGSYANTVALGSGTWVYRIKNVRGLDGGDGSGDGIFYSSGTPILRLAPTAVGIGTASPSTLLSLGTALNNTKLSIYDGGGSSLFGIGVQAAQFRIHTATSADRFSFLNGPAGTEIATLLGTGQLGVGITNPSVTLSLGSNLVNTKLALYESGGGLFGLGVQASQFRFHLSAGTDKFSFLNAPAGSEVLTVLGTGNVGIGTASPGALLSLGSGLANTKLALYDNGSSYFGLGIQSSQMRLHLGSSSDRFSFYSAPAGSELVTIKGSGLVGINQPVPLYLADFNASGSGAVAHFYNGGGDAGGYINTAAGAGDYVGFTGGMASNGSAWIAKATSASMLELSGGGFKLYGNTSLTAGNSFTPTQLMALTSGGLLGVGNTPTAFVDAAASTTSAASLRVRPGSAPTSPNDGDLWNDSATHHLMARLNGASYQLDQQATSTVTKTVAPASSGFVADYYTDGTADDVQIQAAATAAAGGRVVIRNGTYTFAASVDVSSNTIVEAESRSVKIIMANGANLASLFAAGTSSPTGAKLNITFKNMELDGNRANQTGPVACTLISGDFTESLRLENVYAHDSYQHGLYFGAVTNYIAIGCKANNNGAAGIGMGFGVSNTNAYLSSNCRLIACYASGNVESGYSLYGSSTGLPVYLDCNVESCQGTGNTIGGVAIYGCYGSVVSNGTFTGNGGVSQGYGIQTAGSIHNRIEGNRVDGNTFTGIKIANNFGVADVVGRRADRNIIRGNVVTNHPQYNIWIYQSDYNQISDNESSGSTNNGLTIESSNWNIVEGGNYTRNKVRGIAFVGTASYNTVIGANCNDNSQGTINTAAGIFMASTTSYNRVIGGQAIDTQASITSLLSSNASSGQPVILVANSTTFYAGQYITIADGSNSENATILTIDTGSHITLSGNLTHSYTTGAGANIVGRVTQQYGINEASGADHNSFLSVTAVGNITGQINNTGASSILANNQEGITPRQSTTQFIGDIGFDGSAARNVLAGRSLTGSGNGLNLQAGGGASGYSNSSGGSLLLSAGESTGSARGSIRFLVPVPGTAGVGDNVPLAQANFFTAGNGTPIFSIGNTSASTLGLPAAATGNVYAFNGNATSAVAPYRGTTANTAGFKLTVFGGGATAQATNKNSGNLVLSPGVSTGSGTGQVLIQAPAPQGSLTVIASVAINSGGSGYTAGDVLTITGGSGTGGTATVGTVAAAGSMKSAAVNAGGTGYTYGDVLTITGGSGTATATVSGITAAGVITAVTISANGSGYTSSAGVAVTGGTGTGATLNTTIYATGEIKTISVTAGGTGYVLTTAATTTGGTGTGATLDIIPTDNTDNSFATVATFSNTAVDVTSLPITSVADPTNAQDAATKHYIDNFIGSSHITTLGTIATGVWQGTAISHTFLTGIVQADVGGLTTASSPTFAGLNLGTGAINAVGNIEIDGSGARDITVAAAASGAGQNLTIQSGSAQSGVADTAAGILVLATGQPTGTQRSAIRFNVAANGSTGSSYNSVITSAVMFAATSGQPILSLSNTSTSPTGLVVGANAFALTGNAAGAFEQYRHSTSNTAGNSLSIISGGATSGATDKGAGDLVLRTGLSTGQGAANVRIQTMTRALSTGTGDNAATDRIIAQSPKSVTNNSATTVASMTNANGGVVAGRLSYTVEVTDGTDFQYETGVISYGVTNKAGTIANNTTTKFGNQQAATSGTLAVTWTITAANPALIQVNANSSLTPSTGYPRVTFVLENLTQQAVAIS